MHFRYKKGGYAYHEGGPSDERMADAASKRGIELTSLSRPLRPEDLVRFDYILAMDFENKAAIELAVDHWAGEGFDIPKEYRDKVGDCCSPDLRLYCIVARGNRISCLKGTGLRHSLISLKIQ